MTITMDMEVINMDNIQVFIGGIEVVADKNITIKEEMLATPSTILNNCYPKSWEDDHDYYSRFFMPQDYSNCTIYKNGALIFAGVLKNSGSLLLRPTEPKYGSFQILDYKTFLSEGETLDFVIDNKTVEEAIEQVTNTIADYGFVVGNINLTNKDDIINAYSTLNKTAYDVYQYIAEITQSRWFTRIADSDYPLVEMTLNSDGRYYLDGISTQNGTPTPTNPVPIINNYPAGTYQTLINNYLYTFTINDDLRSVGNIADRLWLDIDNNTAEVERKIVTKTFDGTEYFVYDTPDNNPRFSINLGNCKNTSTREEVLSNYFKFNGASNDVGNCFRAWSNIYLYPETNINTLPLFQQWLKDNITTVQYELATSIIENVQVNEQLNNRKVAIDFYSPELMPRANDIQYTQEYFENNNIVDISYSYSTAEYRNKQIILSDTVFASIDTNENIIANGFQTNFVTSQSIGLLKEIYVNGVLATFTTTTNKNIGIYADFYYSSGSNTIEASTTYEAGTIINVVYTPLVKGRQIIFNNAEITRIGTQTGRNGTISRYETRNDVLSTDELGKVAQSYIKYKGEAEITLTVQTKETDLFNIGQQVYFDIPALPELAKDYMVKTKETQIIQTGDYANIFYVYTLSSSYNSETAINYFDNQRRKMNGNIGQDEFISRNIDIENTATLIFSDLQIVEFTPDGDNVLNSILNSPFTN